MAKVIGGKPTKITYNGKDMGEHDVEIIEVMPETVIYHDPYLVDWLSFIRLLYRKSSITGTITGKWEMDDEMQTWIYSIPDTE